MAEATGAGIDANRRKRVTIVEVAEHAGVSHQTVSRYLRFNGGLKVATVEKIEAAIRDLDYRPDLIARSMRTRRTRRIAVVLPELSYFVHPRSGVRRMQRTKPGIR